MSYFCTTYTTQQHNDCESLAYDIHLEKANNYTHLQLKKSKVTVGSRAPNWRTALEDGENELVTVGSRPPNRRTTLDDGEDEVVTVGSRPPNRRIALDDGEDEVVTVGSRPSNRRTALEDGEDEAVTVGCRPSNRRTALEDGEDEVVTKKYLQKRIASSSRYQFSGRGVTYQHVSLQ